MSGKSNTKVGLTVEVTVDCDAFDQAAGERVEHYVTEDSLLDEAVTAVRAALEKAVHRAGIIRDENDEADGAHEVTVA